jgi:ribosome modulation factor
VGVGKNEQPIPDMAGAKGRSRNACPFRIKPDLGQVAQNSSEPSIKDRWDVLHEDESGA